MTTGRPPIRPYADHRTPVVSGLGADEREVGETVDGDQILCGVSNEDGAVFGVEDDVKPSNHQSASPGRRLLPLMMTG